MPLFKKTSAHWFLSHTAVLTGELTIGELASFWFGTVVRGDVAAVTIGRRVNVQDNAVMGVPGKIVRPVKDEEIKYMRWLTTHYVELAEKHVAGGIRQWKFE